MSETLCTLRTKGGGGGQKYTETSLWTNSSPSSNFAAQTITLSDNMTNYKYLKVTYINATGSSVSNVDIVPVSAFITTGPQTRSALGSVGTTGGSARDFARNYKYVADNQINFGTACALNYAAAENNRIIPLEILGLNELDHGTKYITNFVAMYSGSGLSGTTSIASRGYITKNASDGDTISAGATEYFTEQNVSGTSGYIKVYAAKDLDAMVINGYATVTYKNRHFSQGDLIGTINRNVSNTLWIGVYE